MEDEGVDHRQTNGVGETEHKSGMTCHLAMSPPDFTARSDDARFQLLLTGVYDDAYPLHESLKILGQL